MKKLILCMLVFTSCTVQKTYIFQPGDTAKAFNTKFLILSRNENRAGFFYHAIDLKHNLYVEYFSQSGLVNTRKNSSKQVSTKAPAITEIRKKN